MERDWGKKWLESIRIQVKMLTWCCTNTLVPTKLIRSIKKKWGKGRVKMWIVSCEEGSFHWLMMTARFMFMTIIIYIFFFNHGPLIIKFTLSPLFHILRYDFTVLRHTYIILYYSIANGCCMITNVAMTSAAPKLSVLLHFNIIR